MTCENIAYFLPNVCRAVKAAARFAFHAMNVTVPLEIRKRHDPCANPRPGIMRKTG